VSPASLYLLRRGRASPLTRWGGEDWVVPSDTARQARRNMTPTGRLGSAANAPHPAARGIGASPLRLRPMRRSVG